MILQEYWDRTEKDLTKITKHYISIIAVSAVVSLCLITVRSLYHMVQILKGNIQNHNIQAKYKRGWKSLDTL